MWEGAVEEGMLPSLEELECGQGELSPDKH